MSILLDFSFLTILNLFVLLLWPASTPYVGDRRNALGVIILVLTVIAVLADIVFIVIKLVH
ncbi:MAG TPA: hypothetical protein VHV10_02340 [Ktedonobacteraceae bacterium]|jgi:hypothetical protein|nr:hypothetical protein [Ktedonobacteraceae bacterium]